MEETGSSDDGNSARLVRFDLGFRVGVTGGPVFWREGDMPEHWIGQRELDPHLRMIAPMPVNVRDNTFQGRFCLEVRQTEPLSSVHLV